MHSTITHLTPKPEVLVYGYIRAVTWQLEETWTDEKGRAIFLKGSIGSQKSDTGQNIHAKY